MHSHDHHPIADLNRKRFRVGNAVGRALAVLSFPGLCLAALLLAGGCFAGPDQDVLDLGAHQSLVEIGERALEKGEELENDGKQAEANLSYRRALWAFQYHTHLTGEEPLLLEEAIDGKKRTEAGKNRRDSRSSEADAKRQSEKTPLATPFWENSSESNGALAGPDDLEGNAAENDPELDEE